MGDLELERSWELVQIKVFTSWINGYLSLWDMAISDLKELSDGIRFIKFLEKLWEKPLPFKYNPNPASKFQKMENFNAALNFVQNSMKVKLVGTSGDHFVELNMKMMLGCLWCIYRKYRIDSIGEGGKSGEETLLNWVKEQTEGYKDVHIENYKHSFKDGMALLALCDRFLLGNKEKLDYDKFSKKNSIENLEKAFEVAEKEIGVPQILIPQVTAEGKNDERALVTYLSMFYHAFVAAEKQRAIEMEKAAMLGKMRNLESDLDEAARNSMALHAQNDELASEIEKLKRALDEQEKKLNEKIKPEDIWNEATHKDPHLSIPFKLEELDGKNVYTVYHIKVEMMDKIWIVKRRYSEFKGLDDKLHKDFPKKASNLKLPPKKMIGNMNPEFVEQRRKGLQQYIQDICKDEELVNSKAFGDFISRDSIVTLIDEKAFKKQQREKYLAQQQAQQSQM